MNNNMVFRCTRPMSYPYGSPGFFDTTARQSYYIVASNLNAAYKEMRKLFPQENKFDIQIWKNNR